jgi:beta-lactamase superfamily II metal-dependent hydrolase
MRRVILVLLGLAFIASSPSLPHAQAGRLQIHFMDVGQGDGAILIAPDGETVLFDNGPLNGCSKPMAYLNSLGITKIDYQIISHYHADHFGCTADVLGRFPLLKFAYDRGGSYPGTTYNTYVATVGAKRRTVTDGQVITLGAGPATPVTITIKSLNGNGVQTDNENDESVSALVSFGNFRAEIGGDLSGIQTDNYQDIETSVAPKVGQVDVYKVHHHGSRYSTNTAWLQTVHPRVGIVSSGDNNRFGHPTQECVERLHTAGVKLYWTEEGNGVASESGVDVVGGTIVVEVQSGATSTYIVRPTLSGSTDTYQTWLTGGTGGGAGTPTTPTPASVKYVWSKNSNIYHYATCRVAATISASNKQLGDEPPAGKTLHKDCPK